MTDPKDSSSTNPTSDSQGSNNLFSTQGPIDPFFVHHSDNPTAVLVSPMLSKDNYNTGTLTGIASQANLTVASLDNEMSPDAPPVLDSSLVSTSAQPDPPLRSVRPRQPPSYLKHYHCPTLPHVANLIQSDSKARSDYSGKVAWRHDNGWFDDWRWVTGCTRVVSIEWRRKRMWAAEKRPRAG
ncbi:hypothetical protein LWI29_003403 [Acer saccharum]|uniref:Uncharacterized protein n=1 Tax=Acer saccharum TaxID=4024 RepID=A0AA39VBK9_ACESA|nr:hypothetical protein LWI29_003403 [Acer saccharum]